MDEELFYPLPVKDLATGNLIKLVHEKLEITSSFELIQTVRLEFYTDDEGTFGLPLGEAVRLNPNLSEDQKARLARTFQPVRRVASTEGIYLDPKTLQAVLPDDDGNYPPDAIPEKAAWLSVLAEIVPGKKLSDKVKSLLLESMGKMISRGRI
jgi:hypothetical protein